jgi:hypothetical protein
MGRRKGSVIWRYFSLTTPTSSKAVCNACKASVASVVCGVQPEELALLAEKSAYDREVGTMERRRNDMDPK